MTPAEQKVFDDFNNKPLRPGYLKDTQTDCKVVERGDKDKFEADIAFLLQEGFQITSTYCGFPPDGAIYQAILIKIEKKFTEC